MTKNNDWYLQERDQVDDHLLVPQWQRVDDLCHCIFVLRSLDALLVHIIRDHWLWKVADPEAKERAGDMWIGNARDVVVA